MDNDILKKKREEEFQIIKERLMKFNDEVDNNSQNQNNVYKVDYEYIFNLRNEERDEYDPITGIHTRRLISDDELKHEVIEYARESFNIKLNRAHTFERMVSQLTDDINRLNEAERDIDYIKGDSSSDENKHFTTSDFLYTYETILGMSGTQSSKKPNKESIRVLKDATINMSGQSNFGTMEELTQEEIDNIIDPDFILGC